MFKRYLVLHVSVLSLLLSSCANVTPGMLRTSLDQRPVCCSDFSQMKFTELKYGDGELFDVGQESPVYQFPEGKSRFIAVKYPPREQGRMLLMIMKNNNASTPEGLRHYYFLPVAYTLDENYQVKRKLTPNMEKVRVNMSKNNWVYVKHMLEDDERYAVIFSDPAQHGKKVVFVSKDGFTGGGYYMKTTSIREGTYESGGLLDVSNPDLKILEENKAAGIYLGED